MSGIPPSASGAGSAAPMRDSRAWLAGGSSSATMSSLGASLGLNRRGADPLLSNRSSFGGRTRTVANDGPGTGLRATKPLAPRGGVAFGQRGADPLLRASRSTAALPPHRSTLSLAPVPSPSSPTGAGGRPTTPGGSTRAMRNRLEAARLTDQNITLSEDVHRLSSQVEAHMRFHSRAEAATTSWEQKHAQAQDEVAALKGENDALAQKLRTQRGAAQVKERKLETMLAVAKQEMANLRQRVTVQEAQLRRLEARNEEAGACGDESDDDASNNGNAGGSVGEHRPPRRRLSISVALRSPGSGPLMISPMQTPVMTPRTSTPRSEGSTPRRSSVAASASDGGDVTAARLYELQSDIASLRAKLAAEQRRCTEQTELCAGANAKAQAMAQELELKDAQMATLRERVTELELQLAAAGSTGAGAGDDDDGGGFEAALREEMDSMRASYKKKLADVKQELVDVQAKNARREEYWKDQMNDAKQRYLALQMQYERAQRRLQAKPVVQPPA